MKHAHAGCVNSSNAAFIIQGRASISTSNYFRCCDGLYRNLETKQLNSPVMKEKRSRIEMPVEPKWNAGIEVEPEAYLPSLKRTKVKAKKRKELRSASDG